MKDNWRYVILHHTGAEDLNAAQVERYHLSLGWSAVGYNYIIENSGRIVVGRSLNLPGAHCRASGMNFRGIGVALTGNFDRRKPTMAQVTSLADLLFELYLSHDIPPDRILGHSQVPGAKTRCPGRNFPLQGLFELLAARLRG
ncbi:MAG: peptidoglycan recognition family protein [Bacillota bacterium]